MWGILFSSCPSCRDSAIPWFRPNTPFPLNILRTNWYWLDLGLDCFASIFPNLLQLVDFGILFPLNFLISWEQIDGIWPNFAYALILTRSRLGLLQFSQIYNRVMALDWCRNFVSAQYLETDWRNLTEVCIHVLILKRSCLGLSTNW